MSDVYRKEGKFTSAAQILNEFSIGTCFGEIPSQIGSHQVLEALEKAYQEKADLSEFGKDAQLILQQVTQANTAYMTRLLVLLQGLGDQLFIETVNEALGASETEFDQEP